MPRLGGGPPPTELSMIGGPDIMPRSIMPFERTQLYAHSALPASLLGLQVDWYLKLEHLQVEARVVQRMPLAANSEYRQAAPKLFE